MSESGSESSGRPGSNPETDRGTNGGPDGGATGGARPPRQANRRRKRDKDASGPDAPARSAEGSETVDPAGEPAVWATDEADIPTVHLSLPAKETNASWREHALTRIEELDDYVDQLVLEDTENKKLRRSAKRARIHLEAAQSTAKVRGDRLGARFTNSVHVERVMSHIDAAEAFILRAAPLDHVTAQVPAILDHVGRHLAKDNVQREQAEAIGAAMRDHGQRKMRADATLTEIERRTLVAAFRAASEEERAEIMRVRSFRNVLIVLGLLVGLLVVLLGFLGAFFYQDADICFNPVEADGGGKIVCPLNETAYARADAARLDQLTNETATPWDVPAILVVGASAAALSAAVAIRQVKGSSTPYSLPVALAALKIPTGALTALLGLLLLRGQFVPGFSALDFPAQVVAWAVLLGYAQQLLTRLIDQRAQLVLKSVGTPPKQDPEP